MIACVCTGCQRQVTLADELAGQKVACPGCRQAIQVPASGTSPAGADALRPAASPDPSGGNEITRTFDTGIARKGSNAAALRTTPPDANPSSSSAGVGKLGPFHLLAVLGAGGSTVVYRAEDPQLRRPVAVKTLRSGVAADARARQRFLQGARAAAALEDDHVVPIFQIGDDGGLPYLAMQLLGGESLADRLHRAPGPDWMEVVRIGRETALGLAAGHRRGLAHGHLGPTNLWLEVRPGEPPRVKVLDFGLAGVAAPGPVEPAETGTIVGNRAYLAPEQAAGEPGDARADLFALGCILYRLSTGKLPFPKATATTWRDPTPPAELCRAMPRALSELILHLLARDPAQRPESALAVVAALQAIENARLVRRAPRTRRRWGLLGAAAALAGGFLTLCAAGVVYLAAVHGPGLVASNRPARPDPLPAPPLVSPPVLPPVLPPVPRPEPPPAPPPVLVALKNPSFEEGTNGWEINIVGARPEITPDRAQAKEGGQSIRISSPVLSDTALGQEVQVKPNQRHRLTGWVRTQNLRPERTSPVHGTFEIQHQRGNGTITRGRNLTGTTDWTQVTVEFQSPPNGRIRVVCFYAGFGKATGVAWFDGLRLEELPPPTPPAPPPPRPPAATRAPFPLPAWLATCPIRHRGGILGRITTTEPRATVV